MEVSMSDPERWRTWTVNDADCGDMAVFYDDPRPNVWVESTGTFDAFAFRIGGEWTCRMPELLLKGQTVKIMSGMSKLTGLRTAIAERPLPETLEELVQWARMVYAMRTQPS
jgi:hypothetical protein